MLSQFSEEKRKFWLVVNLDIRNNVEEENQWKYFRQKVIPSHTSEILIKLIFEYTRALWKIDFKKFLLAYTEENLVWEA